MFAITAIFGFLVLTIAVFLVAAIGVASTVAIVTSLVTAGAFAGVLGAIRFIRRRSDHKLIVTDLSPVNGITIMTQDEAKLVGLSINDRTYDEISSELSSLAELVRGRKPVGTLIIILDENHPALGRAIDKAMSEAAHRG